MLPCRIICLPALPTIGFLFLLKLNRLTKYLVKSGIFCSFRFFFGWGGTGEVILCWTTCASDFLKTDKSEDKGKDEKVLHPSSHVYSSVIRETSRMIEECTLIYLDGVYESVNRFNKWCVFLP